MEKLSFEQFQNLQQMLRADGNKAVGPVCPVWPDLPGVSVGTIQSGDPSHPKRFWSPRAGGVFTIPAGTFPDNVRVHDLEARKRVSSWIWEKNVAFDLLGPGDTADVPELTSAIIKEVSQRPPLSAEQRIDRALHAIGRPPASLIGNTTRWLFQAATECGTAEEFQWLTSELQDAGFTRTLRFNNDDHVVLTLKGLNRLETGGEPLVSSTAFVAMWFGADVTAAYDSGIAPAIRDAGYQPVRIDREEHSDRIDDQIIAEIRRARFLVCDLTCGLLLDEEAASGETAIARGSVYYEAGFAKGLDRQVIWTCRNDLIEHHVPFDVRQYNIISWECGKEAELRERLATRIRALVP